jgi:hypothetical protein
MRGTLQVSTPFLNSHDDGKHLLVVDLVVQLGGSQLARVERDRVEDVVGVGLGEDGGNGIVGCIGLECGWTVWVEVGENGSRGERGLQLAERLASGIVEGKGTVLLEEARQRASDLGVASDKAAVKVGEAEENLEVAHGGRLGPVEDGRDFLRIHLDTCRRHEVAKVLDLALVERTLLWLGEEAVRAETLKHEADMTLVLVERSAEYEDIIQIDNDKVVQEVAEDVIHQILERRGGRCEAKRHH